MESLTSLRMAKLRDARDETSHWTSDERIMVMEEGSSKPKSNIFFFVKCFFFFCGKGGRGLHWVGISLILGVITLGHVHVLTGKNFTILLVYFPRSFNEWECIFKKSCLTIFSIFLITEKLSQHLSYVSQLLTLQ